MKTLGRRTLVLALMGLLPAFGFAQQDILGNWIMYFGQNRIAEKWSVHTEMQYRSHDVGTDTDQWLFRIGLNYLIQPTVWLTGGYAYISNHPYGSDQTGALTTEDRIWQQLLVKNALGRVDLEHRYRFEQRWIENNFTTRFRYRFLGTLPLNKNRMGPGALFLCVYDEIFIKNHRPYYDRNRFYTALGYQFKPTANIQAGFMNQTVASYDKWYFQVALFYNTDLRKKEE